MKIEPYHTNAHLMAGLVDLIEFCQNKEAHLGIKMVEQDDIFEIHDHYQVPGGDFWVAVDDNDRVVGSIGLLKVDEHTAVLKKFFTYPEYRGQPHRLGQQLFNKLLTYMKAQSELTKLILDTPEAEHRSHAFYEKQGFKQISRQQLAVDYQFPDRQSRIYELNLAE